MILQQDVVLQYSFFMTIENQAITPTALPPLAL